MESTSRLGLLRRSPSFGLLFFATAGSGIGTYLAAIALTLDIYARTDSGLWVAALLIADFLPIVLVGLLLGPLFDRLSRRRLMIASDLSRVAVFAALPFVDSPIGIVGLAGVAGIATGFFRPAALAGLPNLVPDEELTNANSLLQTIENGAWMIGPVLGGVLVSVWSPSVPYAVNAVTFLVSAVLVARIADSQLRSEESITSGHWRDVADGARLVVTALPLRTVLIVWSIVGFGSAAINVAEVFFVRDTLGAGEVGFGVIIGATGLGLVLGSFLAAPALGKVGLRRNYAGSIALMAFGWGGAALSPAIWVAVPFVVGGAAGNGAAIICNQILVQRGAPDRFRGRALSTIMSTNFLIIGLAMGVAGLLTDWMGARWVMIAAAAICAIGALFAVLLTRWLPVHSVDEDHVLEAYGEAAAGMLVSLDSVRREPLSARDGAANAGLERIAVLLEEIELRREREASRRSAM
ncbi:MAG: MFS transporter [Actinobacteria bacterium]|nr:MFS transporter [Actinomycetota bacterium]